MSKRVEDADRVRKAYAQRGERSQKRMTFLIDNENVEQINRQQNKSRYINQLLQKEREA